MSIEIQRRFLGRPTTQAFIMRISDEERNWIETQSILGGTSLAYVVRSLIADAMDADDELDQQRIDRVQQFADFDSDEVPQRRP
jgi:hypothetical protein